MSDKRVPDWLLERYAAGDLSPEELDDVALRIAAEEGGAERLAELRRSDAEIRIQYPARNQLPQVYGRAGVAPPRRSRRFAVGLLLAAAASMLLWTRVQLPGVGDDLEGVRSKGAVPALLVYRKSADGAVRLEPGARVEAGDTLQLAYRAAGSRHGVIVSIDGAGAATLHHPTTPRGDTALDPEGEVQLGRAYQLDDAPDFERFFLVTATTAVSPPAVMKAARRLASGPEAATDMLGVDASWNQVTVGVEK